MSEPFYITTPIYYVNDVPHLGHAYTTIVCDALARFHRLRGDDTRFLTGTDEHGQKVEEAANKRGVSPLEHVDEIAPRFEATWRALGMSNDFFLRTTQPKHERVVTHLWNAMYAAGDLYLETYQGWYCVGCEAFYTESQLVRDAAHWLCAIHKTPVAWLDKERSWFFRLSKYARPLLDHIAAHPDFIQPEAYRNEVVAFLRGEVRDLSVSRTSFQWGIPVPTPDPQGLPHVMYVWLDALANYLTYTCAPDGTIGGADYERWWGHAIHVVGKDILRFHAVYWPCFLLSAKLPLPKTILVHGWWTVRGAKISKSMPATRIDPIKLADALGAAAPLGRAIGSDAMRYYLLREIPLGNDGDFTFESLFGRYNADLANDLGNLVSRTLTLLATTGIAPTGAVDAALAHAARDAHAQATDAFEHFAPSRALDAIWTLVREANRFIDKRQPWQLAKDDSQRDELVHVLGSLHATLGEIGRLVAPVLPTTAAKIAEWLDSPGKRAPLFPRLDDKAQDAIVKTIVPAEPSTSTSTISKADFDRLDIRVGKIVAAKAIPKKDKLLELTVDLGEGTPRTIVAGIADKHAPDALVGTLALFVANLPPKQLGALVSQGMILAAGDNSALATIAGDVPPGTRVS